MSNNTEHEHEVSDDDFWPGYCVELCDYGMDFADLYETIKYEVQRDLRMCMKCTQEFLEKINAPNLLDYPTQTWCKSLEYVGDIAEWDYEWLATVLGNLVRGTTPQTTNNKKVVSSAGKDGPVSINEVCFKSIQLKKLSIFMHDNLMILMKGEGSDPE